MTRTVSMKLRRVAAGVAVLAATGGIGTLAASAATPTSRGADSQPVVVTRSGLGAGVTGAAEGCTGPAVVCSDRVLFGLSTPRVLSLDSNLTSVEKALGHKADLVVSYQDFTEPMYTTRLRAAVSSGRTPVVTWEPFYAKRTRTATYPLARIAAGRYDAYLRTAAAQAKAVGKPFVVRFGHEMNGFWYPWGQQRPLHPQTVADPANTPASYVRAYRHVVDVFRAAGATNVAWMWSPNLVDANPTVTLRSLYPGDSYVDVIGLSGYLEKPTDTFEQRYRPTLTELTTIGKGKPVIIAETGSVVSPTRAAGIGSFLEDLAAERRVTGVAFFSQPDKAIDYRLERDTATQAAIREVLDHPRFALGSEEGGVVARTPVVDGTPRVGTDLTASWAWRGNPERAVGTWFSCPQRTTPTEDCTRIGWGSRLPLTSALRNRYVRATLGVQSTSAADHAETETVGPVLTVPAAVEPAGIDLLSETVRIRFPQPAGDVTRWRVSVDGGAPVHLPASTTEHHLRGLAAATRHTVRVAAGDGDSFGADTAHTFTVLTRPAPPAYSVMTGGYVVTLPPPAPGQTGWVAVADGTEEELPLTTTQLVRGNLPAGQHPFGLRAVSGAGRTNPTYIYPTVS